MSLDAMKQALDALENHTAIEHPQQRHYRDSAIDALRAAIEQAEKKGQSLSIKTWQQRCEEHPDHNGIVTNRMIQTRMQEEIDDLREVIEQAEQPRQWQGLTKEDLFDIASVNFGEPDLLLFVEMGKLVQKELKELNT